MPTASVQRAFQRALQQYEAERWAEAEAILRRILEAEPRHAEALHLLGAIAHRSGREEAAVDLFRQAIALAPGVADFHFNLGLACRACGQWDEAIAALREAIVLKPGHPEAHGNLGHALKRKGQIDEAIAAYREAIALKPDYPEAHTRLGDALKMKGQLDEAIAAYRRAIALRADYATAHVRLGNALKEMGQLDEAIASYRRAIAVRPGNPWAHSNLGVALKDKGQLDEAIACYRRAIALNPGDHVAHSNLGNALWEKGQPDEAVAALRQAIALQPGFAFAHNNCGNALKDQGQLDEAIAAYRQAIALKPDYHKAHSNLIYTLHFHPGFDVRAIAEEHESWNRQHAEPLSPFIQPHHNDRQPDRRLRIGYVSPDLREHPVGRFMWPLLANHDHRSVEVFCYTQVSKPDALTQQLRTHADHWQSIIGLTDDRVAELIREHEIDILVDLSLHMDRNRLLVFARTPAPIQVTYLAYAGTSGLRTMDYRLSDPYLDPPGIEEPGYSEQTIRLPQTYWCYQPMGTPPAGPLPALQAGRVTFGCLNNFCKVNALTLGAWARILQAVPDSQLLLHAAEGSHRRRTAELLQQLGVDPRRLEFVAPVPISKYLELYQRIDMALDPFPYGGGTTSCDAFWMGVPVITLRGVTAVGRAGVSLAMNLKLPELIAETADEYVDAACRLAADLPRLGALRSTLRDRMTASPLMDAPQFARDVEQAYRQMWRKWCVAERDSQWCSPSTGPHSR